MELSLLYYSNNGHFEADKYGPRLFVHGGVAICTVTKTICLNLTKYMPQSEQQMYNRELHNLIIHMA